jgi:hypothetical protein
MSYKNLISLTFDNNKVPMFIEQKGKDWVKYGESNNYPQYLVLLFNRSAKHNAIITSKQLYISGKGVEIDQADMQGDDIVKLQAYINAPNQYETLNDLMKKTVLDYELFGGFYLKVVGKKGKDGVAEIYHVDYCNVRSNEDNTEFYLSSEWINEQGDENSNPKDIKTLPAYDINKKQAESIFYLKAYRPNLNTYTLPDYIGAVPAIITDAEIANYHRAEIQNSFKGSKMITFVNGIPSDDEMKATERKLKSKFTSTDSSGSIVVDFADDKDRAAIIQDLSAGDFADKYNALNNTIQQEIFVGHKITSPMIFGVRVEGQLGGRSEMIDAFNLFTNTYVEPRQQVQERVYDLFSPVKGKIKIKPIEPIMASFSEQTLMQILTKDEMREVIGRKALEVNNVVSNVSDSLNALSPLVANKVLSQLTPNEIRGIIGQTPIEGGNVIAPETPTKNAFAKFSKETRDLIDYETFAKYGEPIENFQSIKRKKIMFSKQDFALDKIDEAVLDLIRKTPKIDVDGIAKVLKIDKTKATDIIETLIAEELIDRNLKVTNIGKEYKTPSFTELVIRYKYALRSDAPPLEPGGKSRDFCAAMMANERYFSREDINNIGNELGQLYDIPNYDAFRRRGGWYHDPDKDVNLPFCRHVWQQELVKRIK